ncbi:uncharacterized protein LOC107711515 [Sinocyclocheilus rhinocerous]|uniref:uncharacterized protein LOC107711515 n=1 Tax=Sinocyclocheilus rhinocerous TaxID=307959 RepID=UPI0007B8B534|nr:PREDICTED: uncharacterized protein LOC107711515 [Sinocyclocheilus rhinocerous]
MKILLIFLTFYLISGQSFSLSSLHVTGYSGASLLVDSGKHWSSDSAKYMVKHDPWRTIIDYKKHSEWTSEGRFILFCNKYGKLMIFIRELNQQDAGKYRIRVMSKWYIDITLNVKKDSCCVVSKKVVVKSGETATFSCEYSQNHINDAKVIFKERQNSIDTWNEEERFSISDDKHKHIFSVRITAVTPDDGGVYLCGVWINRQSYSYSIIITVHLHIISK